MELKGIGASPGISIGKAHIIRKKQTVLTGALLKSDKEVEDEIVKFASAVSSSVVEIEILKKELETGGNTESIEILEVQTELLTDPQIETDVITKIRDERKNASDAVVEVIRAAVQFFLNMKDEYMRARSADVQDAGDRILRHLNRSHESQDTLKPNTIIIAEDISPTDTIALDITNVIGFATQMGGKTSHAAIVAKSKGIPAVVGVDKLLQSLNDGDEVVIDGTAGHVIVKPIRELTDQYLAKQNEFLNRISFLKSLKDVRSCTKDGMKITLQANIGHADEFESVFENGGEGVGLLRTELLFMDRGSFPSEEEQFEFYRKVALKSKGHPVTIRTLDVGGDKNLKYFDLPREQNPFLGYRAIRISLDRKDIFIAQLKAILRASVFGNLKIMFPMICNVQEVKSAKLILEEAKALLRKQSLAFQNEIEVGIMIEIPSAAMTADILASEVDFFSIGTNDLCQYTLAVDRMNEKIKEMYDPFNPGVLRLIHRVIEEGHKSKTHVAVCGELASDPMATLLLVGMGLQEFSMSSSSIPEIKNIIVNHSMADAIAVVEKAMAMPDSDRIKSFLKELK